MAEMGEHAGEIETSEPFPPVALLRRSAPLCRSKRKDPAAVLWQSRRADHDLTRAPIVFRHHPMQKPAASSLRTASTLQRQARACGGGIILTFSDCVTAVRRDCVGRICRSTISIGGELQGQRPRRRSYKA